MLKYAHTRWRHPRRCSTIGSSPQPWQKNVRSILRFGTLAVVAATAVSHTVFEDCRGWLKPSDHVPIMTEFSW